MLITGTGGHLESLTDLDPGALWPQSTNFSSTAVLPESIESYPYTGRQLYSPAPQISRKPTQNSNHRRK